MTEEENQEIIRVRLRAVSAALKDIPGVNIKDIREFYDGKVSVNKKGNLRLPISMPAHELLHDPQDVRGTINGNWKVVPLLLFVRADDDERGPAISTAEGAAEAPKPEKPAPHNGGHEDFSGGGYR